MLVASSSLGLQNVLLRITSSTGLTIALAVAAAFAIATLWSTRLYRSKVTTAASRILLIMLFVRFFIPLLVIGTNLVSNAFLAADQAEATAALEVASRDIDEVRDEVEVVPPADQTMMDRLGAALDESLEAVNLSSRLDRLKESASSATEHIVDLIVLFVIQTILLPLAILWVLVQLLKGVASKWTQV